MSENTQSAKQDKRRFVLSDKWIAVIIVSIGVIALTVLRLTGCSHAWNFGTATLNYEKDGEMVSVKLEREDWADISYMFNHKPLSENVWRCHVNEKLCIKWGSQCYYIAQDGCDLVHLAGTNQCFETGERERLWKILEKYGVER